MQAEAALRRHFGLESFRPLQREIITAVLAGRPAVGILPTGGGKSLCYQLPALMLPGVTLVISPLISLMKDQVDALVARGIRAIAINSQDTPAEGRRKLEELSAGEVRLAFVAPERLRNGAFLEACRRVHISLLAVDEAHCVSQWGHDFRPDYRYIRDFHAAIGMPPLLALTATARPEVREDVMTHLGIDGAEVFAASADRGNLWIGLEACATVAEKRGRAAYLAARSGGSTIVYVSSRKDAESWAAMLAEELGEPVVAYHAGLPAPERTAVQNRFMGGLCRVVVATNAFGMGIDKPDIRAVIHAGVPESLEAYFQEIGRAGRDGRPSACTMVVVPGMDVKVREYLLIRETADTGPGMAAAFRQVQRLEPAGGGTLHAGEGDDSLVLLLVSHLQAMGKVELLQRGPLGNLELRITGPLTPETARELEARMAEHQQQRLQRLGRMRQFVYLGSGCRRQYLLRYFGEQPAGRPEACCSACSPRPLPDGLAVETGRRRKRQTRLAGMTAAGAGRAAIPAIPGPAAAAVLERLRAWRRARAAAQRVPAYVVFGDRDLEGIAAAAPRTLHDLAGCRGVGPVKLEQYGTELLAEIQAALPEVAAAAAPDASGAVPAGDDFLVWVAADKTGAWKAAVRQILTPEAYREIRAALRAHPGGQLEPVFRRLEGRFTPDQIRLAHTVLVKTAPP